MNRKSKYIRKQDQINQFGNRLREIRLQKGLSIQYLADICNLEYSQISRIELGKINTSISTIFILSEALEIEPNELFKFKEI